MPILPVDEQFVRQCGDLTGPLTCESASATNAELCETFIQVRSCRDQLTVIGIAEAVASVRDGRACLAPRAHCPRERIASVVPFSVATRIASFAARGSYTVPSGRVDCQLQALYCGLVAAAPLTQFKDLWTNFAPIRHFQVGTMKCTVVTLVHIVAVARCRTPRRPAIHESRDAIRKWLPAAGRMSSMDHSPCKQKQYERQDASQQSGEHCRHWWTPVQYPEQQTASKGGRSTCHVSFALSAAALANVVD